MQRREIVTLGIWAIFTLPLIVLMLWLYPWAGIEFLSAVAAIRMPGLAQHGGILFASVAPALFALLSFVAAGVILWLMRLHTRELASQSQQFQEQQRSCEESIQRLREERSAIAQRYDLLLGRVSGLAEMIEDESQLSTEASEVSERIAVAVKGILEHTEQQDQLISTTSPSIQELLAFILRVQTNAGKVNAGLRGAVAEIGNGTEVVATLSESIGRISQSSTQIENIVNLIEGISDQVALLSLNAAIEAARAGDSGRGFAVVAQEVSKLSENTAQQVKDISQIIAGNRENATRAVQLASQSALIYNNVKGIVSEAVEFSGQNVAAAGAQKGPAESGIEALREVQSRASLIVRAIEEQSDNFASLKTKLDRLNQLSIEIDRHVDQIQEQAQLQG